MENVKLSVIVPIYGVEDKIERCAISLFEQSLQNIEYIFVDDATKDNSILVLKQVIEKYPQRKPYIKLVHHDSNKGLPRARETGVKNAQGIYIIHCDSDDWMDLQMCEKMLKSIESNQSDIVFCNYATGSIGKLRSVHKPVSCISNYEALRDIIITVGWQVWRFICKAELYKKINFPNETNGEDLATTCQLLRYVKKISYISEPLYNYVVYNNSSSHNSIPEKIQISMCQKIHNTDIALNALKEFSDDTTNEQLLLKIYCRLWNKSRNKNLISKIWFDMYPELRLKDVIFNGVVPIKFRFKYLLIYLFYSL